MHPSLPPYGLSRRSVLQRSALGLGALGLADLFSSPEALAKPVAPGGTGSLAVRQPHFAAKAKRVIHFFCNGGPSQVDTFDHKPMLAKYADAPRSDILLTGRRTGSVFLSH